MSLYIKASTDALTDAKLLAAGPDGFTVFFKGLMYSKQHLTDGFVPKNALPLLSIGIADIAVTAALLVSLALWHECEGGYTVTEDKWAKHQTTRDQVENNREKTKTRVANYRERNANVTPLHTKQCNADVTLPETETETETETIPPASQTPKGAKGKLGLPDLMPEADRTEALAKAWGDFCKHRREKGQAAYTGTGLTKLAALIAKAELRGDEVAAILDKAVVGQWSGIPPDVVTNWRNSARASPRHQDRSIQGMTERAINEMREMNGN